jgi:hypothetical protein
MTTKPNPNTIQCLKDEADRARREGKEWLAVALDKARQDIEDESPDTTPIDGWPYTKGQL